MELVRLKLVTIVAEVVLEHWLVEEIKRLGAKGYTLVGARGGVEGASDHGLGGEEHPP